MIESEPVDVGNFNKVQLANQCRLMADNQRTLDLANKRAEDFHRYESRRFLGLEDADMKSSDGDPMEIRIDSPTTTHHHSPKPSDDHKRGMPEWLLGAGLATALALGAGGLGLGALSLLKSPAVKEIEKIVPGESTETVITPGELIVE